jgi:hypothetical protein
VSWTVFKKETGGRVSMNPPSFRLHRNGISLNAPLVGKLRLTPGLCTRLYTDPEDRRVGMRFCKPDEDTYLLTAARSELVVTCRTIYNENPWLAAAIESGSRTLPVEHDTITNIWFVTVPPPG